MLKIVILLARGAFLRRSGLNIVLVELLRDIMMVAVSLLLLCFLLRLFRLLLLLLVQCSASNGPFRYTSNRGIDGSKTVSEIRFDGLFSPNG